MVVWKLKNLHDMKMPGEVARTNTKAANSCSQQLKNDCESGWGVGGERERRRERVTLE